MTWWIFAQNHCRCHEEAFSPERNANIAVIPNKSNTLADNASVAPTDRSPENRVYELSLADQALDLGTRYEILEKIGEGAFAQVYKIKDKELNLTLAAKVLREELVKDDTVRERFIREANLALTLTHENVVGMYGYNVSQSGQPFIVMDCLEGRSLATILREDGPLPKERFLAVFSQVLDGLSHAHMKGLIHRDLKPENIILVESSSGVEVVKLIDFGIVKLTDRSLSTDSTLTQTGEVFGTPAFMSPEQCLGREVDLRSDIYALGCVMYAALEGKAPFSGDNIVQIIEQQLNQEPPKMVLNTGHDYAGISKVLQKCMAKSPASRYQETLELKRDLDLVSRGKTPIDKLGRWTPRIGWRRAGAIAVDACIVSAVCVFSFIGFLGFDCTVVAQGPLPDWLGSICTPYALFMFCISLAPFVFLDSAFGLLPPLICVFLFMILCSSAASHTMIGDLSHVRTFQQLFIFLSNNPLMRIALIMLEGVIINWLYYAALESSRRQATLGERLFRLQVATTNGKQISFMQATIRHFSKALRTILLVDLARIGSNCLREGITSHALLEVLNQPAHDKVSGCLVLDEKDPLLQHNRRDIPYLNRITKT